MQHRLLMWLELETHDSEIGLLTSASREMIERWPASRSYWRAMRREAENKPVDILEREDRALLYSPSQPETPPTFFLRGEQGWQIDLAAGKHHVIAIGGSPHHWTFRNIESPALLAFREDLALEDGLIRLAR